MQKEPNQNCQTIESRKKQILQNLQRISETVQKMEQNQHYRSPSFQDSFAFEKDQLNYSNFDSQRNLQNPQELFQKTKSQELENFNKDKEFQREIIEKLKEDRNSNTINTQKNWQEIVERIKEERQIAAEQAVTQKLFSYSDYKINSPFQNERQVQLEETLQLSPIQYRNQSLNSQSQKNLQQGLTKNRYKKEVIQNKVEKELIQNCTFKPQIKIYKNTRQDKRNLTQNQLFEQLSHPKNKQQNYDQQRKEKENQVLNQCTFKPNINKNDLSETHLKVKMNKMKQQNRNMDEQIVNQSNKQQYGREEDSNQLMKKMIECTFKPQIDGISSQLTKDTQPIHTR